MYSKMPTKPKICIFFRFGLPTIERLYTIIINITDNLKHLPYQPEQPYLPYPHQPPDPSPQAASSRQELSHRGMHFFLCISLPV